MKEQIEKQAIEEIFDIITTDCDGKCVGCEFEDNEWCFTHHAAKAIYNAGYRKQSEREKTKGCEYCKGRAYTKKPLTVITKYGRRIELVFKFCPNCGAHMKGAE